MTTSTLSDADTIRAVLAMPAMGGSGRLLRSRQASHTTSPGSPAEARPHRRRSANRAPGPR